MMQKLSLQIFTALLWAALVCSGSSVYAAGSSSSSAPTTVKLQSAAVEDKVNVNTASADALAELLAGVGPKKAEAIVAYREANGPFKAAEDLLNVKGIGQATLDKNRERISL